ncbi:type II toxin-antitoxin system HipA family toxin [Thalassospira alkalitolerans]|uniref:type II toxin-antitoxin system HipA family toxin n=1 Tax=Thalassospira alkalitolerans TaxID=1293890 RepID=UPI003AA8DE2D
MISDAVPASPQQAYVWVWLPDKTEPVVAGVITKGNGRYDFNYGQSYLKRPDAFPLYEPELPLKAGNIHPLDRLFMAGCLRDGAPDAWGRRVILNQVYGKTGQVADVDTLDELAYMLMSGSNRIGALDFQASPTTYVARQAQSTSLGELLNAADMVDQGLALSPDLERALLHGTSLGGARPKAAIEDDGQMMIAKFSSSTDTYNVVKSECVAMRLAALVGINVAPVRLVKTMGKDILLVERFDRVKTDAGWLRKAQVSALTIFELDEMMARYASYEDLTHQIRHRFTSPRETLRELFNRLVFNILCGNTDDHARNHAAFWDGKALTLTPAYDICPQNRVGQEASQAMKIVGDENASKISVCLQAAGNFMLSRADAIAIVKHQIMTIKASWDAVCTEASLSEIDANLLKARMFLNEYAFYDTSEELQGLGWGAA